MLVYIYFYFNVIIDGDEIATTKLGGYWNTEKFTIDEIKEHYKSQAMSNFPDETVLEYASHKDIMEHDND